MLQQVCAARLCRRGLIKPKMFASCSLCRTVAAGDVLVVPVVRHQYLLVVYPVKECPDKLVVLYVSQHPGSFSSSCTKHWKQECLMTGLQCPCQPARQVHKEDFLVPEKVRQLSVLATAKRASDSDDIFFNNFWLPNLLGEHFPAQSEYKMVERSTTDFDRVRLCLDALIRHVLGLPKSVYKRLMIFLHLCAIRHVARYFADPNGSMASLPRTFLQQVLQCIKGRDVHALMATSRWESYTGLFASQSPPKNLQQTAAQSLVHLRRMEDLYRQGSFVETMQHVARKLVKLAASAGNDHGVRGFAALISSELGYHQEKLQSSGAFVHIKSSREGHADLTAALSLTKGVQASLDLELPHAWTAFVEGAKALFCGQGPDMRAETPVRQVSQTWCVMVSTLSCHDCSRAAYLESLVEWMAVADDCDCLRAAVIFEEAVLELALAQDSLHDWPAAFSFREDAMLSDGWSMKLSKMLEAYVALRSRPSQYRSTLRHSRMVLTVWALACMQDSVLRNHGEIHFRNLLKNFAPPLAAHALEHLLLPEKRWLVLLGRVEEYLLDLSGAAHGLLTPGPEGIEDLKALAAASTERLPLVAHAWQQERLAVQAVHAKRDDQQGYNERWAANCRTRVEEASCCQQLLQPAFQNENLPRTRLQGAMVWTMCQEQLKHNQAQGLAHCQAELQSLQRPLPSKVQALPDISKHEAEARMVVFCAYFPPELARLGVSFCLARHFFDFEAGFPPAPQEPPNFSWRAHFQEFSACHHAAVDSQVHFELFGDCQQTYRDGEQSGTLFLPVKDGLGIHYPDKELQGLRLLWRWQGALINPFEKAWPQQGEPPACLYRMELADRFAGEDWLLALPDENAVLAHIPVPPQILTKIQYRSLGLMCSELHIRRLLLALQREELPLTDPRVLAACQQVLFRAGPRDEPECFLGRSCKADLEEFGSWASAEGLLEQARALEVQGGPVDSLVCLMTSCGFLGQFDCATCPKSPNPARRAFRLCQTLLSTWAAEAHAQKQSPVQVVNMLAALVQSFRYVPQGCLTVGEAGDAFKLLQARIDLENCLAVSNQKLEPAVQSSVDEVCFQHECQLTVPAILDCILCARLPSQRPVSQWHVPDKAALWSTWREVQTTSGLIRLEPVRGHLLFNDRPVGHLPKEMRHHATFGATVGQSDCAAWALTNQLFETEPLDSHNGKTFKIGMLPQDELLVQEIGHESRLLLPSRCLPKGLRAALVKGYSHWVDEQETVIEFRPAGVQDDRRKYKLCLQNSQSCQLHCSYQGADFYVLPSSEPCLEKFVHLFRRVEPDEWVEYLADAGGCLKEIHLLRLDLKFRVSHRPDATDSVCLESLDYPEYCLASRQVLDMLCGFEGFLLLEKMYSQTQELASRAPGLVLLPTITNSPTASCAVRNIELTSDSSDPLLRCVLDFSASEKQRKLAKFEIHWENGLVQVQTTAARLQLASLLWACGSAVPEKLFGHPARRESLDLLRQCWQNQPYDEARYAHEKSESPQSRLR